MTKKEWQEKHGVLDHELVFIEYLLKETSGKITAVFDYNWEIYYKINFSRRENL